jgi:hypothetical protein
MVACGIVGVPPWVLAVSSLIGGIVAVLQCLLPQESADRVAWWTARWSYLADRHTPSVKPRSVSSGGSAPEPTDPHPTGRANRAPEGCH